MRTFKQYIMPILWGLSGLCWLISKQWLLGITCIFLGMEIFLYQVLQKRFDDFRALVKKVLTPGDLADRTAIAKIKADKLGQLGSVWDHEALLTILYPRFRLHSWPNKETNLFYELLNINHEQWDFEDRVRTEKSIEACLGARECNNRRVAKKNEINKLFEADKEIKSYKGEV